MVVLLLALWMGAACGQNNTSGGVPQASGGKHSVTASSGAGGTMASGGAGGTMVEGGAGSPIETSGAAGGAAASGGTDRPDASGGRASDPTAGDASIQEDAGVHDAGASGVPDDAGSDSARVSSWPEGQYVTTHDVYERLQSGDPDMLLVNVVDEEFYYLGHIAGSLMIPWDTLEDHLDEIDPSRHVVVYCRKGVRSESAYPILTSHGYAWVWVMEGGLEAWTAEGYPTVSG